MSFNCDIPIYFGPVFVLLGCCALTMGALAWGISLPRPFVLLFSRVVNTTPVTDSTSMQRFIWMILGPLNGSVFVLAGLYMIVGTAQCGHIDLGIPVIEGPFAFTWWPGIYPAIAIGTGIGIYNARLYRSLVGKLFLVLGSFWFGLAAGEAVGFHVGPHAAQWGAAAGASWLLIGVSYWIDRLTKVASEHLEP